MQNRDDHREFGNNKSNEVSEAAPPPPRAWIEWRILQRRISWHWLGPFKLILNRRYKFRNFPHERRSKNAPHSIYYFGRVSPSRFADGFTFFLSFIFSSFHFFQIENSSGPTDRSTSRSFSGARFSFLVRACRCGQAASVFAWTEPSLSRVKIFTCPRKCFLMGIRPYCCQGLLAAVGARTGTGPDLFWLGSRAKLVLDPEPILHPNSGRQHTSESFPFIFLILFFVFPLFLIENIEGNFKVPAQNIDTTKNTYPEFRTSLTQQLHTVWKNGQLERRPR